LTADIVHMRHALRLAERALGQVAPNPAVGCVIVKDGIILGRGWTQKGGRPHAETEALKQAGAAARGATAYVTLEPCAHHGQTPPCADALIAAGIARVVGATSDPDPRVDGKGFALLRNAAVAVTKHVCEEEARALNRGFITRITRNRPLVALKSAQSADGYVAQVPGKRHWVTGEEARAHAHLLRARYDAILVGIDTVLADDPELTCRLPGLESRSPLRVVLDSRLRLPATSKLARTARAVPVAVFTAAESGGGDLAALGVRLERVAAPSARPVLAPVLERLAALGITRLLVEGGPTVHAAFLDAKLVDEILIYRAAHTIGEGLRAPAAFGATDLAVAPGIALTQRLALGPDVLESYEVTG
jgi:diaminohydroxyphosphoribosylaminopyrimidine deaminase/5-amino-6-(5-phosphoribosylamino)uracil reductase